MAVTALLTALFCLCLAAGPASGSKYEWVEGRVTDVNGVST